MQGAVDFCTPHLVKNHSGMLSQPGLPFCRTLRIGILSMPPVAEAFSMSALKSAWKAGGLQRVVSAPLAKMGLLVAASEEKLKDVFVEKPRRT